MTFPLVFILSTLEIVSGEKKTFTENFAQSTENNIDPFSKKSDICTCTCIIMWVYC